MSDVFLCVIRGGINVNKFEVRSLQSSRQINIQFCSTVSLYCNKKTMATYI